MRIEQSVFYGLFNKLDLIHVRYYKALDPRGMLKKRRFTIKKSKTILSPRQCKEEIR